MLSKRLSYSCFIQSRDLSSIDLRAIVKHASKVVAADKAQRDSLVKKNINGTLDLDIEKYNTRIGRVELLDQTLTTALLAYKSVLPETKSAKFSIDAEIETARILLVDEFQKLVLHLTNDHKELEKSKKEERKETAKVRAGNETTLAESSQPLADIVNRVMDDVSEKADTLEETMAHDEFKDKQNVKGTTIETVLKVEHPANEHGADNTTHGGSMLIDSKNNQYVLSKLGDITAHVDGMVDLCRFSVDERYLTALGYVLCTGFCYQHFRYAQLFWLHTGRDTVGSWWLYSQLYSGGNDSARLGCVFYHVPPRSRV